MTRFLDTIKAFQHHDEVELSRTKPPDMLDIYQTTEITSYIGHTYTVEARFRTQLQSVNVDDAIYRTRQEIASFVYGDITKELIEWFSDLRHSNNINYEDCDEFYKILDKMR